MDELYPNQIFSTSRAVHVVVWSDGTTIHADGPTGELASGTDAGAVIQRVHDAIDTGLIWLATDLSFTSGVTINKNDIYVCSAMSKLYADVSIPYYFRIGANGNSIQRTKIMGFNFIGRGNVMDAIKIEGSQNARIFDCFGRDCTNSVINMVASDSAAMNIHHFIIRGINSTNCPVGIRTSANTALLKMDEGSGITP